MAIRIDAELNSRIRNVVKRYNSKISRLEKDINYQIPELLPNKVTVKQLKTQSFNRKELLDTLESLEQFTKRGSEDIVISSAGKAETRYGMNLAKENLRRAKISATISYKNYAKMIPKSFGKLASTQTRKTMGDPYLQVLKAKREALNVDLNQIGTKEYDRLMQRVYNQLHVTEHDINFKEAWIEHFAQASKYVGVNPEQVRYAVTKLESLSIKDFKKLYQEDRALNALDSFELGTPKKRRYKRGDSIFESLDLSEYETKYNKFVNNIDKIVG